MRTHSALCAVGCMFAVTASTTCGESAGQATPLSAIAAAYEILSPGVIPQQTGRTEQLARATSELTQQVLSYLNGLPPAESWGGKNQEFQETLRQQVIAYTRIAVSTRDNGSIPVEFVIRSARQDVLQYIVTAVATRILMHTVTQKIFPDFLPSIDDPDTPLRILAKCERHIAARSGEEIQQRKIAISPERMGDIALGISGIVEPEMGYIIASEIVRERVERHMRRHQSVASPDVVKKAQEYVRGRLPELVVAPYTPSRLDQWSMMLSSEVSQVLTTGDTSKVTKSTTTQPSGTAAGAGTATTGSGLPGSRLPSPVRTFATPRSSSGGGFTGGATSGVSHTGKLVGFTIHTRPERKITIPQGSHGNCYLLHGVEPEVGGRSGVPAMFSLEYHWRGPNGSIVPMRNLRLLGTASALAGASRVSVQLQSISYVFPNGRAITQPVAGYIVDAASSQEGIPGTLHLNLERVAPWAMLSAGAEGIADAMTATNTVQVVTGTTSSVMSQTGDKLENALYAGAGKSASFAAKFFERILQDIKPTVRAEAGKRVTAFLTQPVVFDLPEEIFEISSTYP
ncbi:MAG: hypothetical protein N3A02_01805 [Rectinema sp.]|nr:hypothetical protein [Rectinema sp.]